MLERFCAAELPTKLPEVLRGDDTPRRTPKFRRQCVHQDFSLLLKRQCRSDCHARRGCLCHAPPLGPVPAMQQQDAPRPVPPRGVPPRQHLRKPWTALRLQLAAELLSQQLDVFGAAPAVALQQCGGEPCSPCRSKQASMCESSQGRWAWETENGDLLGRPRKSQGSDVGEPGGANSRPQSVRSSRQGRWVTSTQMAAMGATLGACEPGMLLSPHGTPHGSIRGSRQVRLLASSAAANGAGPWACESDSGTVGPLSPAAPSSAVSPAGNLCTPASGVAPSMPCSPGAPRPGCGWVISLGGESVGKPSMCPTRPQIWKTSRAERLRRLEGCRQHKNEQAQRLRQFNALPSQEAIAMQRLFTRFDVDRSGRLNRNEVIACLRELGLHGVNTAETREIAQVCEKALERSGNADGIDFLSFTLTVVPQVRQRLSGLQNDDLMRRFMQFDPEGDGYVSLKACLEIASSLGLDEHLVRRGYVELCWHQEKKEGTDAEERCVSFEELQQLLLKTREVVERSVREREQQVKELTGIHDETFERFRQDLVGLYELFQHHDTEGRGALKREEAERILLEFGLLPTGVSAMRKELDAMFTTADLDPDGLLRFEELLGLVDTVRSFWMGKHKADQMPFFRRYDKMGTGSLSVDEVSALMCDIGLTPQTHRGQAELVQLIRSADLKGTGRISFSDFQSLSQRSAEKLYSLVHEAQVDHALSLNFSEEQLWHLQQVFNTLDTDGSGQLDASEVRNSLTVLNRNVTDKAFDSAFRRLDVDGSGSLDFTEFLEFLRMLRDGEGIFSDECHQLPMQLKHLDARILRSVLERFHFSRTYSSSLPKAALLEHVCDCLSIGPSDNLQESLNVRNVAELYELAERRRRVGASQ